MLYGDRTSGPARRAPEAHLCRRDAVECGCEIEKEGL